MNIKTNVLGLAILFFSSSSFAIDLSIGDPKSTQGQIKLSGIVLSNYVHKNYDMQIYEGDRNDYWDIAGIQLALNYDNPNWEGYIQTRCYQYDRMCEALFLRDAWLGYKISEHQKISAGLQPVDFGFGRLWGSSYYETILNTVGLEDINNLGLKYQYNDGQNNFTFGFYPRDGGNYKGTSKDASRYSGNFVTADDLTSGTNIKEKNMFVTRASKKVILNKDQSLSTELGGSAWYSKLENKKTHLDGDRNAWNIFANTQYKGWQWSVIAGEQNIDNADTLMPNESTIGAFDYAYQVANKGKYVANEINYSFQEPVYKLENFRPYLTYSRFIKDKADYIDSERLTAGLYFSYKSIGFQGEYIFSRNDPMLGGSANGLAQGDSKQWNQMLYILLGYYF